MRKPELEQLFAYTDYVWNEFRRVLPDSKLLIIAQHSGWPTVRSCLVHMVMAYERWLPAIVELQSRPLPAVGPDDLVTWEQIDAARSRVRATLGDALRGWGDEELALLHDMQIDGEVLRYSRGELIAHLLLHERGHHGDITTLMWQLGIEEELPIEYRFFLGRHKT
ncbi:MAG TPA: DinB family protein [Actinomycetota bacterium]|nr:DinB family protein [Actinomycetota bacterium]